jgi:RND family efflux transporter MFP subunit
MNRQINFSTHFFALLGAIVFGLSACHNAPTIQTSIGGPDTIPVQLLALTAVDTLSFVDATGTFTSEEERVMSFKQGGILVQMRAEAGDRFRKGELLAQLEQVDMQVLLNQAELVLEKAIRDDSRAQQLYADSVATLEQVQNAATAKNLAQQDVDRVRSNLQWTQLVAPYDGYVLQSNMRAGQVVGPGTPVVIISNAKPDHWMVKVGVSERVWSQIQMGDQVEVRTDASNNQPVQGVVAKKAEAVDPTTGQMTLFVRLTSPPMGPIAVGMLARVRLQKSKKEQGWYIPYAALLDGQQGTAYVFVTEDQKTVRKIPVQLGAMHDDEVFVTSGLENVRYVITSGGPYLNEKSNITVKH